MSAETRPAGASVGIRAGAFVVVNVALVALYLDTLVSALPPLVAEGRALVVVPVSAIATVAFATMHPMLRRLDTHAARLALFAGFVAAGIGAFTTYVVLTLGAPEPTLGSVLGLAALVALAQLLYGAPLFLALAAVNKLLSPVLVARPARAWV